MAGEAQASEVNKVLIMAHQLCDFNQILVTSPSLLPYLQNVF